ncbi:hypothetical protein [Chryseobacterium sp. PET-29]|uniref:hypothetical protein n=1 Tax=Chryseobacterium sp. PET-29 TaxID=2983267 RepID=UPI0021E55309|nr:hypothetical protein [Chryseobacterium sp. PET-29]
MKKFLFAAVLVAGTTLGFAKSSTQVQYFSKNTKAVVKSKTIRVSSLEEAEKIKNICHKTVFTTRTYTVQEEVMGVVYTYQQTQTTFYTYWYGC